MADEAAKREQAIADYRKRLLGKASALTSRCWCIFKQRVHLRCVQQCRQRWSLPALHHKAHRACNAVLAPMVHGKAFLLSIAGSCTLSPPPAMLLLCSP